ncbi:MAG: 50S ribosomal protein L11 methyltransferase [Odoribacteraceae bacterium]|nr:50S ribosomal protein L11 methyltransferase [Odoribacteraceae bacterium]
MEVTFHVRPADEEVAEMIAACLEARGFENFLYTEDGVKAYAPVSEFDEEVVEKALAIPAFREGRTVSWEKEYIEEKDWNKAWEESFRPVVVAGRVRVRAGFHEADKEMEHEIVIDPKMSFGTGHHPTTALMLEAILEMQPLAGKVIDAGCGTGILSIMAAKAGATEVLGFDVDEWAYRNALENAAVNGAEGVRVFLGDGALLDGEREAGLVLANISRNALVEDMPRYARALSRGGRLVASGFYGADLPVVREAARVAGLAFASSREEGEWCVAIFNKGQ